MYAYIYFFFPYPKRHRNAPVTCFPSPLYFSFRCTLFFLPHPPPPSLHALFGARSMIPTGQTTKWKSKKRVRNSGARLAS